MSLTLVQQSLVNIGASVGAGCHPCLTYHLEAGKKAGLSQIDLAKVLSDAQRVKRSAMESFSGHGNKLLGEPAAPSAMSCGDSDLAKELISIGVAVGANAVSELRSHVAAARAAGLTDVDVAMAVNLAQGVQQRAAELTARAALPLMATAETARIAICGPACGCNDEAPRQAQSSCDPQASRVRVCGDALRYVKAEMSRPPKRAILACEGACLKGEVARVAANTLAYRLERDSAVRICLGDATTANSGMTDLVTRAPEVIAVEGCPLHCATEILKTRLPALQPTIIDASQLYTFDRGKYFEIFDLPRTEIEANAEKVAQHIQQTLFISAENGEG